MIYTENDFLKKAIKIEQKKKRKSEQKYGISQEKNECGNNWIITLILCTFLGFIGAHRIYVGKKNGYFFITLIIVGIILYFVPTIVF